MYFGGFLRYVCLAGCAVVSVFGSGDYDRKKKVTVICLAGCAVVSVFVSGNYGQKKTLALHGLEEPAHASRGLFLINTLLLYPSLSPYSRTDGLTDRGTNTLARRGLEEPKSLSLSD